MRAMPILMIAMASMGAWADATLGEKKAQLCLLCHKPGNALAAAPILEAQPAPYLVKAIGEYKRGTRPDPVMKSNVAALSARDIQDIADYFASRAPVDSRQATDPAKVEAGGKRVAELACASCHGTTFAGSGSIPRLAGQTTGYLVGQLEAFAGGRRAHPSIETTFDKIGDVEAVAQFLASQRL